MSVRPVMEKAKKCGSGLLKLLKRSPKPGSSKIRDTIVVIGVKQAMVLGMLSAEHDAYQDHYSDDEDFLEDPYSELSSQTKVQRLPKETHLSRPQSSSDSSSKPRGKLVRLDNIKLKISNFVSTRRRQCPPARNIK